MENFNNLSLASILRGLYATPIICELSKKDIFKKNSKKINLFALKKIKNKFMLNLCLDYLEQIQITEKKNNIWVLTDYGFEIFRRSNSFFVPHSYRDIILNLGDILLGKKSINSCNVDRNENILGSGLTHLRYFYQPLNYCNLNLKYDTLIDLGCGNGHFINLALQFKQDLKIVGMDLSSDSVKTCKKNIDKRLKKKNYKIFKCDISKINEWKNKGNSIISNSNSLISMWFMLHEISGHKVEKVKKFLNSLHKNFPNSNLLVGEIIKHDQKTLNEIYKKSLMPEYLFFHKVSGQGILSWQDYKSLLVDCPYSLEYEWKFDDENKRKIPSAFVWILKPRKI
tara:strand:- start:1517 stop:2536 length:1020 start_codon:yes stop_codon:yes gene_type:complete